MQLKPWLKICLSGLLLFATFVPLQSASAAFFPQSVASGDPRPDSVILWTRVVDLEREGEDLPLTLSVAADPEFASVVMTREGLLARAAHDGCVKVEVPGLAPGTHYWYRFTYRGSETSPVGRTKTAPAPDQPETVRFAFLNCQDYVGRYYNTLAHLVEWEADSLDFIVHLGDYVYETTGDPGFQIPGEGRSIVFGDSEGALDLGGFKAARSLDNYRDLYRIYRSDPVLQRLHELFPVIAIWDDHEFSDDRHGATATYFDGSKDELDIARLHNSEQAFFEYLPIGIGLDDLGVKVTPAELFPNTRIFRDFHFGAHVHLLLTDYRTFRPDHLIAEDAFPGTIVLEEPVLEDWLGAAWSSWRESLDPYVDIDDPQHAVRKATLLGIVSAGYRAAGLDAAEADHRAALAVRANLSSTYVHRALEAAGQGALALGPEALASLPRGLSYLFLGKQDLLSSFGSRYGVARDTYALYAAYRAAQDPASQDVLGQTQQQWLAEGLAASAATWKIVASSVSFCPIMFDFAQPPFPLPPGFPDELRVRLQLNADHWDGFPQARQQMIDLLGDHDAAIISGDIHGSFMTRHLSRSGRGVPEFTGPSVSSETFRAAIAAQAASNPALANVPGIDQLVANTDLLIRDALGRLPEVELVDLHSAAQGYVILEINATELRARYVLLAPGNVRLDYTGPHYAELLDALAFESEFGSTRSAQGLTLEKLTSAPTTTRLQLLHASDLEGGVEAIVDAPNFAAITEYLRASEPSTLVVNAGDSYIPGPFFGAAGDPALRSTLVSVNETLWQTPGLDIREGVGRADLTLMNIIGFDASSLGNHEFDSGTAILRELIATDIRGATPNTVRWLGAQFPFLSANLDFASDANLSGVTAAHGGQLTTDFQSLPADLNAARRAPKLAPSTLAVRDGQVFGLVGATTPLLAQISSPGATRVREPGAGSNNMADLASILQPVIDSLLDQGINKIILVTHLQQLPLEQELVPLLRGVDIAIAGGSDSILANPGWPLRPGSVATGPYPIVTQNADGEPALIVSTDGQYKYVGRLLVDFDDTGIIQLDSLDPETIGPWPTESDVVYNLWGSLEAAFAPGTRGDLARQVAEGVLGVVNAKDGQIMGRTRVFIEGRRALVRTEETTLGNLSADANLALAQSYDPTVVASIKNGGGIRAEIGFVDGYTGALRPPAANPLAGKRAGEISQLDIENSLRFNNALSLLTVSAVNLKNLLEHGLAASGPGLTPGQFPQVGGLWVACDLEGVPIRFDGDGTVLVPGTRIRHLGVTDPTGAITDLLVADGMMVGDPERPLRIVTLDFLANPQAANPELGGDGYPFPAYGSDRVNLREVLTDPGAADFAAPGTEQDALAEFLLARHGALAYVEVEIPASRDGRIVKLGEHQPHLLNPVLADTTRILTVPTIFGWRYEVQVAESLAGPWQSLSAFTGAGGRQLISEDGPGSSQRYYRLRVAP